MNEKTDANRIIKDVYTKKGPYWKHAGEENMLRLFHEAALRVPAYNRFLKEHGIRHDSIRTIKDFQNVPLTSKANYLRKYPFQDLFWDGALNSQNIYTATSGSTGKPQYFCRDRSIDWQCSVIQELFLLQNQGHKESTLVIVCFGMGIWIGGLITFEAYRMLGDRGYPISVITPGINKAEIFRALKILSPKYERTILCGYPPFIKDVIDEAPSHGINLKKLHLRISMAAEPFSEDFRDYISRACGLSKTELDTTNVYGSADIGAMAFETPLSISVRRAATENSAIFKNLFGNINKTPTLAQYIPRFISFETIHDELVLTGRSAMPLIRYRIGDNGGTLTYQEVIERMNGDAERTRNLIQKNALLGGRAWELPFVYIYERNDLSATVYGLQVYPETIREILLRRQFASHFTGKFVLITRYNEKQDQYLEVNLELRKGARESKKLHTDTLGAVIKNLVEKNAEYKELLSFIGKRAHPRLKFWSNEDQVYFKPGIKQRWVMKEA
jgi:phenylacetate-CoA ligase